eukprot:1049388-Pyramimonas_sp.AAC.1
MDGERWLLSGTRDGPCRCARAQGPWKRFQNEHGKGQCALHACLPAVLHCMQTSTDTIYFTPVQNYSDMCVSGLRSLRGVKSHVNQLS